MTVGGGGGKPSNHFKTAIARVMFPGSSLSRAWVGVRIALRLS